MLTGSLETMPPREALGRRHGVTAPRRVTKRVLGSPSSVASKSQHSTREESEQQDGRWQNRRPVNAGLLALSALQGDMRRRLLGAWLKTGSAPETGTASSVVDQTESLLDFIAARLNNPSPELALCRIEQLTRRAARHAGLFEAPDPWLLNGQRWIRRAPTAGVVPFPAGFEHLLSRLLPVEALPARSLVPVPILIAPGSQPLCRIATVHENECWRQLVQPAAVSTLIGQDSPLAVLANLLRVGALEYA
jgi:hypothetical protein